jgi:hypothetical protein
VVFSAEDEPHPAKRKEHTITTAMNFRITIFYS